MNSFMAYISHLPKRTGLIMLALMSVLLIGAVASASFGPDRPTKAMGPGVGGFDYVTFNSFTNVPDIGDERNFFQGQIMGDGVFYDPVANLRDGDEVMVRVYVHNNADASLNESGRGIAKNTKVRVELPTGTNDAKATAKAYVSASNANPETVWDELDFSTENGGFFDLEPIAGSATVLTNFADMQVNLDQLLGDGVLIGDDGLDGEIRGCFEYTALVTFKVKVKMPRYTLQKQVRLDGEKSEDWREVATVKSGETVEWGMEFTNAGSNELKHVKIVDEVPANTEVVKDSVRLYNGNYPSGYTYPNSAIQANGTQVNVDIGNYTPTINGWVLFKTVVDPGKTLGCGTHELINNAFATPENYGAITNGAKVIVDNGPCEQDYVYECTSLTAVQDASNRLSFAFTTKVKHSDNVSVNKYIYDFGVSGEDKVHTDKSQITKVYKDYGKYNVNVEVLFDVDGEQKSDSCSTTVEVMKTPPTKPPVTPPAQELPNTGSASLLAGLFGTGALGYGTYTFRASREGLRKKILGQDK